ncbi:MAG TPA: VOC family protein [Fimbriimonas sp.]|nr:VOC family protein [Fimbriimonas sp.]
MAENNQDSHALNEGSTFVWHELYSANVQASIDFYTNCLDFGHQAMDMGEMGSYPMLTKNGQGVAGIMDLANVGMDGVPPHWAVYLAVDDVDARVAKCTGAGAKVVVPAMDIPTVGRMCLIQDPQGSHIWLYKPSPMG